MRGRAHELLLGSYVLRERLGEGHEPGLHKARNWKLGRVVALKLIRKDRLEDGEAVRRFHREIRAAAQLDHPNIVRAFDADEIGGTHLLVMEYAQGVDLAKLVKQGGPLPVGRACDCARQAALGLQHAFERGLVHRDVKPQNLLATPVCVVKILDMGLARLGQAAEAGEGTSTMTQEGAVMGTLDYIAPEQAMDSHTVDIRADLYSLGCTLYFLLTGRVPFPGGTAMEKFEELVGAGYYPIHASGYLSGGVVRFAAVWVARPAPRAWEAHHIMAPAVYQVTTATLRAGGMRPTYVSAFADAVGSHAFAAQFVEAGDTPGVAVQDLTAAQYRQAIDRRQEQGYRSDQVSAYDAPDGPRFAAVFVKDGAGWAAREGLSSAELRAELDKQAGDGLWPTSVAAYRDGGETRYAAVWSNKNNP